MTPTQPTAEQLEVTQADREEAAKNPDKWKWCIAEAKRRNKEPVK